MEKPISNFDFNKFQAWVRKELRETQEQIRVLDERDVERMLNEQSVYHKACERIMNPKNYN